MADKIAVCTGIYGERGMGVYLDICVTIETPNIVLFLFLKFVNTYNETFPQSVLFLPSCSCCAVPSPYTVCPVSSVLNRLSYTICPVLSVL
jgi:hypothetical protein